MNFDNKSVVVVGAGGSLKDSGLGKKIDEFDIVIRVNYGFIHGYEEDVGTKETIWTSSKPKNHRISLSKEKKHWRDYNRNLEYSDKIKILNKVKEIWYTTNNKYDRIDKDKWLQKKHSPLFYVIEYKESIYRNSEKEPDFEGNPTTGNLVLRILNNTVDKFYIAGFDCYGRFSDKEYGYIDYYNNNKDKLPRPTKNIAHKLDFEYDYVKTLLKNDDVSFLKKDTKIQKSHSLKENEYAYCNHCDKEFMKYHWQQELCPYCLKEVD